MRVLIITAYYSPDGGPAAPLFTMLCEGLAKRGHEVTALTAVPHYPTGIIPPTFRTRKVRTTLENGVRVIRVPLPSVDRSKLAPRLFQFLAFQISSAIAGLKLDCDAFITHSPALEVWLPFFAQARMKHKPAIYSVHDVYPGVGIRLGIFTHRAVIRGVSALEKFCLMSARRIRVLSKSFRMELIESGVPDSRIELIYDWVDLGKIKPLSRANSLLAEFDLSGKFVLLYAGNFGLVQGLESVLDAAQMLLKEPEIVFVFIGDGAGRTGLVEKVQRLGLENVRFFPYQPRERMPEVFSLADVCLVTLKKGAGYGALPSKTYSIMASGRPVLASLDPGCDAWDLIERSGGGLCVPPESPDALAQAILQLKGDEEGRKRYGVNGRQYVEKFHSAEYASEAFERLLLEVVDHRN